MKKTLCILLAALSSLAATAQDLEKGFKDIPDSIQTAVYWYWMNNNISREGVIKDLQAMKEVGINRAFIGNQQADDIPYGNVRFGSDEWLEITRTAMKTAADLGIEIGMFNCPGWSQSGGPWVKPEESMRYLSLHEGLPGPDDSQVVKVLAIPSRFLAAEVLEEEVSSPDGVQCEVTLKAPQGFTARTLEVTADARTDRNIEVFADGKKIKEFFFDRHRVSDNVGFIPLAPVVVTLPETCAETFTVKIAKYRKVATVNFTVRISDRPAVESWPEKTLAKMFQDPLPMWDHYMWAAPAECTQEGRVIDPESVVDITDCWRTWTGDGFRFFTAAMKSTGVTNSPAVEEATGLEIDKMSRRHIRSHFDAFIGELIRKIPAEDRRTWDVVVQDSYETGGLNWTDDMAEVFRDTYGYDPTPYIPAMAGMVVGSADESERFLWDLRRLIADRVATDYVGGLRDVCHEYGMETWLETYGHWGFPSEFLLYGGNSDQIAGEYWSEGSLGDIENRAASSCGHIYGKNKIWAESCTAGAPQYSRYPRLMKERVDRFFCEGINATLLHLFIQQPDDRQPGLDAWFGNEFNRNNSWWDAMDVFVAYLKRCNLMLQQGRYVADAAYFIGEDAPKMTGECTPALPKGHSFDYINADVLKNHSRVKNGLLVLDSGMQYRVLVLPDQKTMRPEMLDCIRQLVWNGLTVVGPAPEMSPSLQNYGEADAYVSKWAEIIWNAGGRYGNGYVYGEDTPLEKVFAERGIAPDFICEDLPSSGKVSFIHRTLAQDGDIYFVANQREERAAFNARFRVDSGLTPELWDPVTGENCGTAFNVLDGGFTEIPMQLDSLQSVFVVFRKDSSAPAGGKASVETVGIDGPWTVEFAASCGNKAFKRRMTALQDWAQSEDEAVKYYSGEATYRCSFNLPAEQAASSRILLDLGKVMVIAKVYVNGKEAGGVWTPPYALDITDLVRKGRNTVEVKVYNNWRNRLVRDASLPEGERHTWTNISPWKEDSSLQPSGLLGPVRLQITER